MGDILWVVIAIVPLAAAIGDIIEWRKRGWRPQWRKTFTTFTGVVVITGAMTGLIYLGVMGDRNAGIWLGAALAVYIVGMVVLIRFVNRKWPPQKLRP